MRDGDAFLRSAIILRDHDVLRYDEESSRQISGLGSVEGGIGHTLSHAVSGNEVLDRRKSFLER